MVTAQICEFGNLGCIPGNFTGCVRDLEEVNGLATSWPFGWAKPACLHFEGGRGIFCWFLLSWLRFLFNTVPACPAVALPEAWSRGHLAPLRGIARSQVGYRRAWDVTHMFLPSNTTTVGLSLSVQALGMVRRWVRVLWSGHVRLRVPGELCTTCTGARCMFLPNKPLLGVQTPLTTAETLWPVNSWSSSHRWSLLQALVPNGLIWVCLFVFSSKTCKNVPVAAGWIPPPPETTLCSAKQISSVAVLGEYGLVLMLVLSITHKLLYCACFYLGEVAGSTVSSQLCAAVLVT